MISVSIFLFMVTLVSLKWFLSKNNENNKGKWLPGPRGIPLFGNLRQAGNRAPYKFSEWALKYGDIFKIRMGSWDGIVVSDPNILKELFTTEPAFTGRDSFEGIGVYPQESLGVTFSSGEIWEVHRRFLLRHLRDFGFGKSSMEQLIIGEVNETILRLQNLQKAYNSVTDVRQLFTIAVINSLFSIVASKRWSHDDSKVHQLLQDSQEIAQQFNDRFIFVMMPWTRYFLRQMNNFTENRLRDRQFYIDIVEEHKATYEDGTMRDFVDVYLDEMTKEKNNPQSQFYGDKAERQLHQILGDLHVAGSDTVSATIQWSILYLTTFKNVQEKLQNEISEITGENTRQVSITDKPKMPYTLAVMDEVFRMSSLAPLGVLHSSLAGKDFKGYWIKKGTLIIPNLYHIHHNKKIWGDPENFRPERFLSKDGLKYKPSSMLMPFQIGRRQCIGESLARSTFFLFLTNIFQKFSISFDPNSPAPTLEPHVSFLFIPKPFSIVVKERI